MWKIQRKAGLRFFSNANLKTFMENVLPPIFADTEKLLDDASRDGNVVDLQIVLLDLTTRLMGNMAYDVCAFFTPVLLIIMGHLCSIQCVSREIS